jgi:hypothetical protein
MKSSSSARGLDISIASEHFRSSLASRADINSPGPAFGCPGSTSTFSGQHILPRAGTRLPRASIFMSRPTYAGLRSTLAFPWPAYTFSGHNSCLRAGVQHIRPLLAGINIFWAVPGQSRPVDAVAGPIPAWAIALKPGLGGSHQSRWVGLPQIPAGPACYKSRPRPSP